MDGRKTIRSCGKLLEAVYVKAVMGGRRKDEYSVNQLKRTIEQLNKIEKYF